MGAQEIKRPMRLRTLAPRNFQNSMIGFGRMIFQDSELFDKLAWGIRRLVENHDPVTPKTKTEVLFSYTCLSGAEVPADAFRISGLATIAREFEKIGASGSHVERCLTSMAKYVWRSI